MPESYSRHHELEFSLGDFEVYQDWEQGTWRKASQSKTKTVQSFHRLTQFKKAENASLWVNNEENTLPRPTLTSVLITKRRTWNTPSILTEVMLRRWLPHRSAFHLYPNAHNSFIHHSPKLGTTQMPSNRWMVRQMVVHSYHGMLFNKRK